MFLFANGCSFTWGGELNDRKDAYPTLLSKKLNYELIDYSECGASNDKILRTSIDFLTDSIGKGYKTSEIKVVIGWSGISRREFYDEYSNNWQKITPTMTNTNPHATAHFKYLQSEKQDNIRFYHQVLLLQSFLKQNNIDYFFFRIDDGQTKSMIKDGSNTEVTDGFTLEHISNYMINFIDSDKFPSYVDSKNTFRDYALSNGGGLKPQRHPDEKSHEIFSDYIYKKLIN